MKLKIENWRFLIFTLEYLEYDIEHKRFNNLLIYTR